MTDSDDDAARLHRLVDRTVTRAEDKPLAAAAQILKSELRYAGFIVGDDWCRTVLQTYRRGEPISIRLG